MRAVVVAMVAAGCSFEGVGPELATDASPGADARADASADAPPMPDWLYRRRITIDNSGLGTLSDFGLLLILTPQRITYASTRPNGEDLRFTDAAGTPIAHELEAWVPGGGSIVWVGVPTIAAGVTTDLWMHYGNPNTLDAQRVADVWDGSYVGVWHLVDADDSTETLVSTNQGGTSISGRIGPAMNLAGSGEYVETGTAENIPTWTMELWMRPAGAATSGGSASGPINRYPNYQLQWNCNDPTYCATANFQSTSNTIYHADLGTVPVGTWSHVVATYDGSVLRTYVDGAPGPTTTIATTPRTTSLSAKLGARPDVSGYFTGGIDEVRISRIARTPDYVAAQLRSMTDAYVAFGPEQAN